MAETISVEQVNQMRKAMGLPLIPVPGLEFQKEDSNEAASNEPGATLEEREAQGSANWAKLEEERIAKENREKRKEQIRKAREQAARNAVIQGSGIADVEDDLGATDWLKSMKKRQAKIEAEEAKRKEAESKKARAKYTSEDLAGIRVAHQLGDLGQEEAILTFKDQAIGEGNSEDEFELESRELRESEQLKKKLEAKKFKGVAYNPVESSGGLLSQYDDVIDGPQRHEFVLDSKGGTSEQTHTSEAQDGDRPKGVVVSLESLLEPTTSLGDYKEVKVKKPKKSKKTARKRNREEDDDDIFPADGAIQIDIPAVAPKAKKRALDDANFDDDEDLQLSLARSRRQALKARKTMKASDIAKQIKDEDASQMALDTVEGDDGGLVIAEASEWTQNLDPTRLAQEEEEDRRKRREASTHTPKSGSPEDEDGDAPMQSVGEFEEAQEAAARATRTPSAPPAEVPTTGIDEEEGIGEGLAATLKMLKDRHIVETGASSSDSWESRQRFLAQRAKQEEESEYRARQARERERQRTQGLSARDREELNRQANAARDQQDSRQLAQLFSEQYRPNVELQYVSFMKTCSSITNASIAILMSLVGN
jgi:U4/U6.U5 tri-snRNP-associated protein 1